MKKAIKINLHEDWINEIYNCSTIGEAIKYLSGLGDIKADVSFYYDIDYDDNVGSTIYSLRPETDEEEIARKHAEAKQEAAKQAKHEKTLEEDKQYDVAIRVFLEKYKDHPKLNEMSGVYKAILRLDVNGRSATAVKDLKEFLEGLIDG